MENPHHHHGWTGFWVAVTTKHGNNTVADIFTGHFPVKFPATVIMLLLLPDLAGATTAAQGKAGIQMNLLFDRLGWIIPVFGFLGLILGGFQKRVDPFIRGQRVFRHDGAARLSHWTHAVGCALLLASGLDLGFFFFPPQVINPAATARMFDLHFSGALLFVFGGVYWLANTIVSPWRFREHMPDQGSLKEGILHYAHIFGLSKTRVRPAKYNGSERLAFVPLVLFAALLSLTGLVKLAARSFTLPGGLMASMTWLHDLCALIMLVLFVFHVLLAAVVPWSWPLLQSMFSGWVSRDFALDHHAAWYDELKKNTAEKQS